MYYRKNTFTKNKKLIIKTKRNKMKRNKRNKTKRSKTIMIGGNNIIGQGTHGIISVDPDNQNIVIKSYSYNKTFCANLQDEYKMQEYLHTSLLPIIQFIYIPYCCCYTITANKCQYKMDRIFPLEDKQYYVVVNLNMPNIFNKFSHSRIAYEIRYNKLFTMFHVDIDKLCYELGILYSYLHYVLFIDGYDCELLYGRNKDNINQFFFIDYDKVQRFKYELGHVVYRKVDETTIENKVLSTETKFAWFLYSAMASMSLIPSDKLLYNTFIAGYKKYIPTQNKFIHNIANKVIELIYEMNDNSTL